MRRPTPLPLATFCLGLSLYVGAAPAVSAQPEPEFGFEVGNRMPFHVVDFIGKGPGRGGCPSVMISNSRNLGVEIWSRSLDDATLELAKALQNVVPIDEKKKRPNTFLLLFGKVDEEAVAKKVKPFALDNVFLCEPRSSANKLIHHVDLGRNYSTMVFIEERKVIKAVFRFPAEMLNERGIESVVEKTRRLLTTMP